MERCPAIKRNGEQCTVTFQPSGYRPGTDGRCRWHSSDAEAVAWQQAIHRRGGQATQRWRRLRVSKPAKLEDIEDALAWQVWVTEQLADGQLDPKVAQQISKSVEVWMRAQGYAVKLREFRKQLDALKKAQKPA